MTALTALLALIFPDSPVAIAWIALGGAVYYWALRPRLQRLEKSLRAVEYHLAPNGDKDVEAHPDDRDAPMRVILARVARRQREVIKDIQAHTAGGSAWRQGHEIEHLKRDPEWPVTR